VCIYKTKHSFTLYLSILFGLGNLTVPPGKKGTILKRNIAGGQRRNRYRREEKFDISAKKNRYRGEEKSISPRRKIDYRVKEKIDIAAKENQYRREEKLIIASKKKSILRRRKNPLLLRVHIEHRSTT
jgi:hypothetical protein